MIFPTLIRTNFPMRMVDTQREEVVLDLFIAKMRFKDTQRELCICPSHSLEETLTTALFQEKGYVTASALQKQMDQNCSFNYSFSSQNILKIKSEPTRSIRKKNNFYKAVTQVCAV